MIWSDETHIYCCTDCHHTGAPCPEAMALARHLVQRLGCACAPVEPDAYWDGFGRLEGCARTCPAKFVVSEGCVSIYCDVEADEDPTALAAFALSFLGAEGHAAFRLPAGLDQVPCSIVQAVPRESLPAQPQAGRRQRVSVA